MLVMLLTLGGKWMAKIKFPICRETDVKVAKGQKVNVFVFPLQTSDLEIFILFLLLDALKCSMTAFTAQLQGTILSYKHSYIRPLQLYPPANMVTKTIQCLPDLTNSVLTNHPGLTNRLDLKTFFTS